MSFPDNEEFHNICNSITQIYNLLENVNLRDLPEEYQKSLEKQQGPQFGIVYREYMIRYLKTKLNNK